MATKKRRDLTAKPLSAEAERHAVIYARYSSHSQRDVSIEQQVRAVRDFAERQGLYVIDIYADRALTGTSDQRPEFQRMIRDAEKGAFVYVIVYTLDRFARDRYDSAVYKRQLRNCGVKVLSAMENISDDPTGVLMESMLEGLAEYYSKELSRKIKRGMEDNAEKCMVNGALGLGHKRGADGRYEIDEAGAAIVKESFERVAAGEPFVQIFEDYNLRGLRTKTGKEWNRSSFNKMLTNERYRGVYIYGDTRIESDFSNEMTITIAEFTPVIGTASQEGADSAVVTWNGSDAAEGYVLYMAEGNGEYAEVGEVTSTSYTATGLTVGTSYSFKVASYVYLYDGRHISDLSEAASVTITELVLTYGDFEYDYTADKTGIVITKYNGSDADVVVPETIENLPIVEIGDSAFEGNTALVSIDLPDTVQVISVRAFANCTSLTTMD